MESYQSHRSRLFVSADDFGVSPRANRNIRYLISMGKIDRVGVMAYGKFSDKEIDEISRSGVKLDIHLDILHEFHENRGKRQSPILRGIEFLGKLFTGKLSSKKIEADWRKQIEKFKEIFGKNPDGINSHEHVHFFPPFFKVALKLETEYSIPYIRFGDSVSMLHHKLIAHILHFLRIVNKKACKRAGCVSSGSLVSLDWINNLDKFMDNLPEGTIEIACHPELAEDFSRIREYF
jgi:chitin disaccharide deacetylase